MRSLKLLVVLSILVALVGCQSGEKQSSSTPSVSAQDAAQAKKQLEEQGIEITDQFIQVFPDEKEQHLTKLSEHENCLSTFLQLGLFRHLRGECFSR